MRSKRASKIKRENERNQVREREIEKIRKKTKEVGALLIVDGTQSVGQCLLMSIKSNLTL